MIFTFRVKILNRQFIKYFICMKQMYPVCKGLKFCIFIRLHWWHEASNGIFLLLLSLSWSVIFRSNSTCPSTHWLPLVLCHHCCCWAFSRKILFPFFPRLISSGYIVALCLHGCMYTKIVPTYYGQDLKYMTLLLCPTFYALTSKKFALLRNRTHIKLKRHQIFSCSKINNIRYIFGSTFGRC